MSIPSPTSSHPVAISLRENDVTRVAVVDDVYDTPGADNMDVDAERLVAELEGRPDLREALTKLSLDVKDTRDINNAVVATVWEHREDGGAASELAGILLGNRLLDWRQLEALRGLLEALGLEVACMGCDADPPAESFGIVFLDYYYGPINNEEAVQAARDKAAEFFDLADGSGNRRFLVLMSSTPQGEAGKEPFRKASGLLKGLFGYLPKSQLGKQEQLLVSLGTWAAGLKHRHAVQRFAEALCAAADDAAKDFSQRVMALSFEDYANIQHLSLRPDGHPLGDYMLWLYKAVMAHLLHERENVLEVQSELDRLRFSDYCPSFDAPSEELADIYGKALTIPGIGPVGPHPIASNGGQDEYLRMRGLFGRKAGSTPKDEWTDEVRLPHATACDLMYSPGAGRPFPATRSLFLLPGRAQPIGERRENTLEPCLELVRLDGRICRVYWQPKHVCAVRYGKAGRWLKKTRFERIARLSLPYVLELQQGFAADMARVGPPVAAPIQLPLDVQVYCRDVDGSPTPVGDPICSGALLVQYKVGRKLKRELRLAPACLLELGTRLGAVDELISKKEEILKESMPKLGEKEQKRAERWLSDIPAKRKKLQDMMKISQVWFPLLTEPVVCPKPGECSQVQGKPVCIYFGSVPAGDQLNLPAVLCVEAPEPPEGPPASGDAEPLAALEPEAGTES